MDNQLRCTSKSVERYNFWFRVSIFIAHDNATTYNACNGELAAITTSKDDIGANSTKQEIFHPLVKLTDLLIGT